MTEFFKVSTTSCPRVLDWRRFQTCLYMPDGKETLDTRLSAEVLVAIKEATLKTSPVVEVEEWEEKRSAIIGCLCISWR